MFWKLKFLVTRRARAFLFSSLWLYVQLTSAQSPKINVFVFSKTVEFRHESIGAGRKALAKLAIVKGVWVTFTEDASQFKEEDQVMSARLIDSMVIGKPSL